MHVYNADAVLVCVLWIDFEVNEDHVWCWQCGSLYRGAIGLGGASVRIENVVATEPCGSVSDGGLEYIVLTCVFSVGVVASVGVDSLVLATAIATRDIDLDSF